MDKTRSILSLQDSKLLSSASNIFPIPGRYETDSVTDFPLRPDLTPRTQPDHDHEGYELSLSLAGELSSEYLDLAKECPIPIRLAFL